MKPVVSSIVALAIAITPVFAMAAEKSTQKPVAAHVAKHHKKVAKAESKASDKPIAQVKHVTKKDADKKSAIQKVNHEVGHKGEPKADQGVTVIPASMTSKQTPKAEAKPADLPKLPAPAVAKHGKEKGAAKKAAPKKSDDKSNDGQLERDEDFAELVARIRGQKSEEPKPSIPSAKTDDGSKAKHVRDVNRVVQKTCNKEPVEIARGSEIETFELTGCDGSIAPMAVDRLSILVRPGSAARPTTPLAELAKKQGRDLAKGIKRIDPGLVTRLQAIADHFGKKGTTTKFEIVSGYRPASVGSLHQTGRAMDFHVDGVKNEDIVAFCKSLTDTGCGYYPNSSFVHVDVREPGAGHVSWIDASGPGETPRYVASWPPPEPPKAIEEDAPKPLANTSAVSIDTPPEPVDDHPAETNSESTTQ